MTGYVDPLGVRPGDAVGVHLSAPAAYTVSVARLGRTALLRPEPDDAADRAEAQWLAELSVTTADRSDVYPGSYARVDGPDLTRPASVSAWVRLWRLPATVETSSWSALVSDFDYPERCHWALGVDADGHPGCYVGDGRHHDRVWWCLAGSSLLGRLGEWVHLAFTVDGTRVRLWVDGELVREGVAAPMRDTGSVARGPIRLAAAADSGLADHFLDGDLSDVTLFGRPLTRHEVVSLTEDRAMASAVPVAPEALLAHWPMRERSGSRVADVSGQNRHGTLVNTPTLNLPGPCASPAIGRQGMTRTPTRPGAVPSGSPRMTSSTVAGRPWPR